MMETIEAQEPKSPLKDGDHQGVRPISPTALVEFLRVVNLSENSLLSDVGRTVGLSADRAREISIQASQMGLLRTVDSRLHLTESGKQFLQASLSEDFEHAHEILQQYDPIAALEQLLSADAFTVDELSQMMHYNQVAVETFLRLIRWSNPHLRRNRFKGTYYLATKDQIGTKVFMDKLVSTYSELVNAPFNIRREYVKIPEIRAAVCESLQLDGQSFDRLLISIARLNPNKVILSSAPAPSVKGLGEKGLMSNGRHLFYLRVVS